MKNARIFRISLLLASALALAAASASATEPLPTFLERAKQHSFDAREAQANEQMRQAQASAALGKLVPSLSARAVYTRNEEEVAAQLPGLPEKLVITPLNQLDAYFQLDVPIIDLASYHRYKAARATAEAQTAQSGAVTLDVSRSVARAYYQFLGAQALLAASNESIKAAQANLKNVDDRRSAGAATDLDHERAAASVARAEQDLADAQLGSALAARSLETLSGLSPSEGGALEADDLHAEGTLAGWMATTGALPQDRAAQKLMEAQEQDRKAASRALLPTLAGSAQERITNATGFSGKNSSYVLQLTLSWRLDYGTWKTTDAQAAAVEGQRVRTARTRRMAEDAVFEAFKRVEAGIAKSRSARAQASAADRAAELSMDRYGAGVATQLDVTQAQRDAFLANAAKIQADADLAFARASLRLAAGIPVSDRRTR